MLKIIFYKILHSYYFFTVRISVNWSYLIVFLLYLIMIKTILDIFHYLKQGWVLLNLKINESLILQRMVYWIMKVL